MRSAKSLKYVSVLTQTKLIFVCDRLCTRPHFKSRDIWKSGKALFADSIEFPHCIGSVRGCLDEKTRSGASLIPGGILDFVTRYKFACFSLSHEQHDDAIQNWWKLRMRYPFQSTGRPISHWNEWSFRVYMIPLRNFVAEWNSRSITTTGVNSRRCDSRW